MKPPFSMVTLGAVPRPTGVAILAILGFLGGAIVLIGGLGALAGAAFLATYFQNLFGAIGAIIATVIGITLLITALIVLLLSWGLWAGKNWARILVIIGNILFILLNLLSIVASPASAIIGIIIDALIIFYLTRPGVAAYFKGMPMQPQMQQPPTK